MTSTAILEEKSFITIFEVAGQSCLSGCGQPPDMALAAASRTKAPA